MTKEEIINFISTTAELSEEDAQKALNELEKSIKKEVEEKYQGLS